MFDLEKVIRPNIKLLKPYRSARAEYQGDAEMFLDANESPYPTALNRYPDPYQSKLKKKISQLKGVAASNIFVGNGSDEAIDLLFRAFCEPGVDKAYLFTPTYGMYKVSAQINNIEQVNIPLTSEFELPSIDRIKKSITSKGLLFICSPNNPTGNIFPLQTVSEIAYEFDGLVVLDEAYIDFSDAQSGVSLLAGIPNLVVLQTLSKAYGLAGLRLGLGYANENIITVLNKIKPPYNINTLSQAKGLEALGQVELQEQQISEIITQRERLFKSLNDLSCTIKVYPSQANFLLTTFQEPQMILDKLRSLGIIIRDRRSQIENGLRISVGSPEENTKLINILKELCA